MEVSPEETYRIDETIVPFFCHRTSVSFIGHERLSILSGKIIFERDPNDNKLIDTLHGGHVDVDTLSVTVVNRLWILGSKSDHNLERTTTTLLGPQSISVVQTTIMMWPSVFDRRPFCFRITEEKTKLGGLSWRIIISSVYRFKRFFTSNVQRLGPPCFLLYKPQYWLSFGRFLGWYIRVS